MNPRVISRPRRWLLGWLLTVLVLLWLPGFVPPEGVPTSGGVDWLVHAALFLPGGYLLPRSRERATSHGHGLAVVLAVGFLLAVLTESGQMVVPGRHPSVADGVADLVGITLGWGLGLRGR